MEKIISIKNCLTCKINDGPEEDLRQQIHERIKAFNDSVSEHHRSARKEGVQPLNVFLFNEEGALIGGLTADTFWGWLNIDDFWIDAQYRQLGIGQRMLEEAEKEALVRNCHYAKLSTFSFQARDFYEKYGYKVVGELKDFPPGQSFYLMRKDLNS